VKPGIHPDYKPGNRRVLDTVGQVEKFRRRYGDGGSEAEAVPRQLPR
jgi:ribosomal protein L31